MNKGNKNARITEETIAESDRLNELWHHRSNKLSQAEFGEKYGIGSQSAITQFLKGTTPISMKAAIGFAEGLGCEISDFSPRLAKEAQLIGRAVQAYQVAHAEKMKHVFEKDSELTEKAEIELLKMQAELAQKDAEIARKEAETAKALARAEIAEAKLEILKPQTENYQLMRDLLKRTEARLTETEKVLNEMQEELITIKKDSQRAA